MINGDDKQRNGRIPLPSAIVVIVITGAMGLAGWNLGETEQVARRVETIAARQLDVIEHNSEQDKRLDGIEQQLRDLTKLFYQHDRRTDSPP